MTKQIPKTKKITKKKVNSTKKKNLTIKDKFLKPRTEKQKQEYLIYCSQSESVISLS